MDDDGYEQTQALTFEDSGDETDEETGEERPANSPGHSGHQGSSWPRILGRSDFPREKKERSQTTQGRSRTNEKTKPGLFEVVDQPEHLYTLVGYLKVLCQKGHPEKSFPLYEGDNVIGRHDSCIISIPLTSLSREHACIEVRGQSVFIFDKGSRNRTRRNKHFLQPEVRYELRDKDKLVFGDVECVFQKEDEANASGSETGSESMFETAPIDEVLEEPKGENTLKLPLDTDYQSDASSDILEPTQPFGSQKETNILKNNNSTIADHNRTHNITVKDTPAPPRSKRITDNLVLPESGSETEGDDESAAAPTLAVESQQSDDDSPRKAIMGAATQAYVCESDVETEEEVTPKKKALLMAATQAYVEEEEEEDSGTPRKKSILTAATQAYVEDSDDAREEEETPLKAKRNIIAEPTQAYTLAAGIEPTQAYNMDDESNDGSKESETHLGKKSLLFEPTQAYTGDVEDEDSIQGETEKKSVMYEPTQAYPGNTGPNENKGDAGSETSEEFTLDDDEDNKGEKDEDVSHIFMAPTLACDTAEDSNQSESNGDEIQEMETQAIGEDQTQVHNEAGDKEVKADDATQEFTDDSTEKTKKVQKNDEETQVLPDETQVLGAEQGTHVHKERTGDEATQAVTDETQVVKEVPDKVKGAKGKTDTEEATQVFTDETLAVADVENNQRGKTGGMDNLETDSEQPTQAIPDATVAVEDLYHQNKEKKGKTEDASEAATQVFEEIAVEKEAKLTRGKNQKKAKGDSKSEAATQVFEEAAVEKETRRTRGRGKKAESNTYNDSEAATQVFEECAEEKETKRTRSRGQRGVKKKNESQTATQLFEEDSDTSSVDKVTGNKKTEDKNYVESTPMFTQGVEEDDNSQNQLIIRAVATLAAEENDEADTNSIVTDTKVGSEAATQVFDETVALGEMETLPVTKDNITDTVAVADAETVSVKEQGATLPLREVVKKSKSKGRGQKGAKAKIELKDATLECKETLPIVEPEEEAKPKGKGRKAGKTRSKSSSKQDLEPEAATQVYDSTETSSISETIPISKVEEKHPNQIGRKQHIVPDMEPQTQTYDEKIDHSDDEAATQVIEPEEPDMKPSRKSSRQSKKRKTEPENLKESHLEKQDMPKAETSADKEETAEKLSITRSRGRRGKQANDEESSKINAAPVTKRKGKAQASVHEAATQIYDGEEATQRYGDECDKQKGMSIEEDDLTPPLSEEFVPDSEETVTSLIIPAPPLIKIPSRSPHKSAIASPGRKKSPSPKRVHFVKQGSEETEPTAGRGRRGRKVLQLETEGKDDDKKEDETTREIKPVTRRGRRSVQISTENTGNKKAKEERKSLPTVLEIDSNKGNASVSDEVTTNTAENEVKVPKGRKGKSASKTLKDVNGSVELKENSEIDDSSEQVKQSDSEEVAKTASKRTRRGRVASDDSVTDKNEKEIPEADISNGSKRLSGRSKNRQSKTVENTDEAVKVNDNRTDSVKGKLNQTVSTEIAETSHKTRKKVKNESQESDVVVTGEKGTRKTTVFDESDNSDLKDTDKVTTTSDKKQTAKQKKKGAKQKEEKCDKSELSGTVSEKSAAESTQATRSSRRKGKESESQNSQTNETKTDENKNKTETSVKVTESKETRTSTRKGRSNSLAGHSGEQKSDTSVKNDLKEITNLKNNAQSNKNLKDNRTSRTSEKKNGKTTKNATVIGSGKVTRGKISGPAAGSGDAAQAEEGQTPAKRRKTTIPGSQTSVTPKATSRRATVGGDATLSQNSAGTPKGTNKKLDSSLSSSPSLRKTDHAKPKVMFTGVTDEQCEKFVKELGGEMASSVYHCTHLVTDQVRRTVKFLCCLSRGVPICTPQWIISSKRTSVFSDPSPFLISDDASEKKFKFSLQLSLDKANEKLFLSDYKIHVTKSVKPEPNQMKDIIQCASAKYLASMPKTYSDQTVVISCEEDKAACDGAIKAGIPIVSSEFILTGALRQEADINSYRLFSSDKRKQSVAPESEPNSKKRRK